MKMKKNKYIKATMTVASLALMGTMLFSLTACGQKKLPEETTAAVAENAAEPQDTANAETVVNEVQTVKASVNMDAAEEDMEVVEATLEEDLAEEENVSDEQLDAEATEEDVNAEEVPAEEDEEIPEEDASVDAEKLTSFIGKYSAILKTLKSGLYKPAPVKADEELTPWEEQQTEQSTEKEPETQAPQPAGTGQEQQTQQQQQQPQTQPATQPAPQPATQPQTEAQQYEEVTAYNSENSGASYEPQTAVTPWEEPERAVECPASESGYHSWASVYDYYIDGRYTNTGISPAEGYYTDAVYQYSTCTDCGATQ